MNVNNIASTTLTLDVSSDFNLITRDSVGDFEIKFSFKVKDQSKCAMNFIFNMVTDPDTNSYKFEYFDFNDPSAVNVNTKKSSDAITDLNTFTVGTWNTIIIKQIGELALILLEDGTLLGNSFVKRDAEYYGFVANENVEIKGLQSVPIINNFFPNR